MNLSEAVLLPCRPSDSLQWILPEEGPILWQLDLGLEMPYFPLEEEMQFHALELALSKFTKEVWPVYQERTLGAILYRGHADFNTYFSWTERQIENWNLWNEERPRVKENHLKRLFCADAFAHYFQMLSHVLPDEIPLYLLFDVRGISTQAESYQVISKERFEFFHVAAKGLPAWNGFLWEENQILPGSMANEAICFPEESSCSEEILEKLDVHISKFKTPFRIIPESFLTEEWEGVDVLYFLPEAISDQGKRKLSGFRAAGGTVIELDS